MTHFPVASLRALVLVGLLSYVTAVHAAKTPPAQTETTRPCPDQSQVALLHVSPDAPPSLTQADLTRIKSALENAQIHIQDNAPRAALANNVATPNSFSDVAINGLYTFLTRRAREEVESYIVDVLQTDLCSQYSPYFPNTCGLFKRSKSASGVLTALTLQSLRAPVEQDLRYLPACLIHNPKEEAKGSDLGYLVMDVFRQLTSGAKASGNLFYGLASDPHVYMECHKYGNDSPSSPACQRFEVLTGIAAAIEVAGVAHEKQEDRPADFLRVYLYDLALFTCPAGSRSDPFSGNCNSAFLTAVVQQAGWGGGHLQVGSFADIATRLISVITDLESLSNTLHSTAESLSKASGTSANDYRAQVVALIGSLAGDFGTAYTQAACLTQNPTQPCVPAQVTAADGLTIKIVSQALAGYADFSAGHYVEGVDAMPDILDAKRIPVKNLVLVAQLAESKTSDDFASVLDEIASPAGSWRQKRSSSLWTVSSFVGAQGGLEKLQGQGASSGYGTYYGAYIPLGFAYSHPAFGKGYWGGYLGALDLGVLASNHINRGQSDPGAKSTLSSVLSPAVSIFVNPGWLGPLTFGVGYAYRTPGLRTTTTASGAETKLDSSRIMITIGVDVTVFQLTH